MLVQFLMVLCCGLNQVQDGSGQQDEDPGKFDTSVFLLSFEVDLKNQLTLKFGMEHVDFPNAMFPNTMGLAEVVRDSALSNQLNADRAVKNLIAEKLATIENDYLSRIFANDLPASGKVSIKQTRPVDLEFRDEILQALNQRQRDLLQRRLEYKRLSMIGLVQWLKLNKIFDASIEKEIKQSLEKEKERFAEQCDKLAIEHAREIVALLPEERQQRWEKLLGKDFKWVQKDPYIQLFQSHYQWKFDKLVPADSIFELNDQSGVQYSVDLEGELSRLHNKYLGATPWLAAMIHDGNYGGVGLTKRQRTEMFSGLLQTEEQNKWMQQETERISAKAKEKGFAAVKDDFIEMARRYTREYYERLEETLLPHQKEFVEEIARRRLIGVCGVDYAIAVIEYNYLKQNPELVAKIQRQQEIHFKKLCQLHQDLAQSIWSDLEKSNPKLKRQLREKIPGFRFEDIEYPSLLFVDAILKK